ncbi:MAG: aminotransferase class IV, partial [Candidatus Gracilibacteria bacterium]|nr:aminotransferase class IV [Candidatus Gracilibacteria bacterium]
MILEVSKNGAFIPESEEVLKYIHPSDELPEGVYESIRTYYDRPFRLKEHLKRLKHSADLLGMKLPYDRERILSWTLESIEKNKGVDQFLKVIATAADVLIFSRKLQLDRSIYQGVRATLVNGIRPNPKAKSLSVMTSHEAAEQAKVGSFYEALLVNDEGYCTEG